MDHINVMRANVAKALAHPLRLDILDMLLADEEKCVCDIVAKFTVSQSSISKHLSVLKEAGLVSSRQDGMKVLYRIRTHAVHSIIRTIDTVLHEDLAAKSVHLKGSAIQ